MSRINYTTMTNEEAYNYAFVKAWEDLQASEYATDSYVGGTSFITIRFKENRFFYNWAKQEGLIEKDGYYGTILSPTKNLVMSFKNKNGGRTPYGTLAEEYFNKQFCKYLNSKITTGAFTHTRMD